MIRFWKALDHDISNMQKCLQNVAILMQLVSVCHIGFQKSKKRDQNQITENELKQRLSLLQEKLVIQAVCLRTQAVSRKVRF